MGATNRAMPDDPGCQHASALSNVPSAHSHTVKVIQRYQLNHSHENAQYDEARTEDPLAAE